ncbi:MAG: DUF2938 domain-containing protein [Pseudomonadota bacterium]
MTLLTITVFLGLFATALTDLWALARKRALGIAAPDFGLVGRWMAHLARGRFRHERIAATAPVRGERLIGWTAHYLIGVAFAALLPALWGVQWLEHPALAPALIVGVATLAAPFLLMQPGMGAGIAASRTPRPTVARFHSIVTHTVFGLGLYASALIARRFL